MKKDTTGKNAGLVDRLKKQNEELRVKLREAEETLQAIREGAVDAVVVSGPKGEKIFTLTGEERVYRDLVETMNEAGLTTTPEGKILFCNERFGRMLRRPMKDIIGQALHRFVQQPDRKKLSALLDGTKSKPSRKRMVFTAADGTLVPARVSANLLRQKDSASICLVAMDMTELEASEEIIRQINEHREALQKSEERFRMLFDGMTEGFSLNEIVTDKTGKPCDYRFLEVNPAFERLTGLRREDVVGKLVSAVLPGNDPSWIKAYGEVALGGKPVHFENYSTQLQRHFEVYAYRPMPRHFAVIFSDITGRKQMEYELAVSRNRIQSIIDNTPAFVYALDLEERFLIANKTLAELFNTTSEEIIGKKRHEFMPRDIAQYHEANDKKVLQKGAALEFEEYGTFKGRKITFLTTKFPLRDAQGNIYAVAGISAEITERKKQEQELYKLNRILKALGSSSQARTRAIDESSYLNEACKIIEKDCGYTMIWIGYAENDEGKNVKPVAYAGFEEGYLETLKITWADTERGEGPTGTAIRTGELCVCKNMPTDPEFGPWRKEALKRGYASSIALPLSVDGKAFGALTIYSKEPDPFFGDEVNLLTELAADLSHGITAIRLRDERAGAEELLMKTAEELRRSNSDLEQFAYVASHDLREPLRTVASFADLLSTRYKDKLDDEANEFIYFLTDGVKRMDDQLAGLLEYSRVQTGSKAPVQISVGQALDAAIANLQKSIDETGAAVFADEMPTVKADARQLTQLFQNLIANAIKFRGDRKPEIHIACQKEGNNRRFSVRDNGIGIEPQFYERIFLIFQRLHPRDAYPGYGIGLSICKKIVERHGGRIWLESQPGRGATFYFTIPE